MVAGPGASGRSWRACCGRRRSPFIAIDPDVEQVDFVRRFGNQIYYGDPTRLDLLRSAGAAG